MKRNITLGVARWWSVAVVLFTAVAVLPACNSTTLAGRPDRSMDRRELLTRMEKDARFHVDELVIAYHDPNASDESKREIRDCVVDIGILMIDQHYSLFVDEFSTSKKNLDTFADIGSIATDAAATLFTPPLTKSILAAVSGGITASQATISKNYFYERTITALIKQMESQRRVVQRDLVKGTGKGLRAYPLSAAMADLERYYFAGTVDGAVSAVQQSAAEREQQASADLASIRDDLDKSFKGATTAGEWLKVNGLSKGREKFLAFYNGQNDVKKAVADASIIAVALDQLSADDAVALLPEPKRARGKEILTKAGATDADKRTAFANELGDDFDVAKYLKESVDASHLAKLIGSFHDEGDILGLKQP